LERTNESFRSQFWLRIGSVCEDHKKDTEEEAELEILGTNVESMNIKKKGVFIYIFNHSLRIFSFEFFMNFYVGLISNDVGRLLMPTGCDWVALETVFCTASVLFYLFEKNESYTASLIIDEISSLYYDSSN
jgi:hypothetical protein